MAGVWGRFQVSDYARAAIASSVLKDHGLISADDSSRVIDCSKLRRERQKHRKVNQKEEDQLNKFVNSIDGRKDATQVIAKTNKKHHQNVQLEEHYVVVDEPRKFYLSRVMPTDDTGLSIAKSML